MILFLKDKWLNSYKKFLPIFYYTTITLSIPVFVSFMLLKNNLSLAWLMNFNIGIMVLVLLVDSLTFIIIEIIGISVGSLVFYLSGNEFPPLPPAEHLNLFIYMFLCITILGTLFSRNKEKYHDYIKQLKDDLNASLEEKVQERTASLERALSAKTEFLNNMSHEVRTPIQGIVNVSEGLVDQWDGYNNDERKFYASKVAEYSKRLISLVSNLLDLSKFNIGRTRFEIKDTDLIILVKDMIGECRDLYIKNKSVDIEFDTDQKSALVRCDSDKITQVLRNLFANAIKFTPSGTIKATLEKCIISDVKNYRFTISDSGVGIPFGEEIEIFEPFTQSSRTKTKAGGTGLGLAICKSIIDAHKGMISARNNDDIGVTIEFTIPSLPDFDDSNNLIIDLAFSNR